MADNCVPRSRELAHNETRRLLVAQNETISDIDEKAMRSVRLTTIVVGVLIAAIELAGVSPHSGLLTLSLLLLVGSMISGIATYDESDLFLGPRIEYIQALDTEDSDTWFQNMTHMYAELSRENRAVIRWNARLLRVTNASLIGGIILALTATTF